MPSRGRAEQCRKAVDRFFETAGGVPIEIIVITEDHDAYTNAFKDLFLVPFGCNFRFIFEGGTAVEKWNRGAKEATHEWLLLGSDDLWAHEDWAKNALVPPNKGFVGFNDTHMAGTATHYMITKQFCREVLGGVFCPPMYKSWGLDVEVAVRAKAAGRFLYVEDAVLEHRHFVWGAQMDATYMAGMPNYGADCALFNERENAGFPNVYEAYL
jgi:hypothetical protein